MDKKQKELKQWEKPQLTVILTTETNETVLKDVSGGLGNTNTNGEEYEN